MVGKTHVAARVAWQSQVRYAALAGGWRREGGAWGRPDSVDGAAGER